MPSTTWLDKLFPLIASAGNILATQAPILNFVSGFTVVANTATGQTDVTATAGAAAPPGTCGLRLSLTTGVPVTITDVTGAATIYLTPHKSGILSLYTGSAWQTYSTAEVPFPLSGLTPGANYDVFAYAIGAVVSLAISAAWATDTTRTDALGTQDGITVLASDHTKLWVGTFRATGTGTTEDSVLKRLLWNRYNAVPRVLGVGEATASWTWPTSAWHVANANTANAFEYVTGAIETLLTARIHGYCSNATPGDAAAVGVGIDSVTAPQGIFGSSATATGTPCTAEYKNYPGLGFHTISWLEYGSTGTTFFGQPLASVVSGMQGEIQA